MKVRIGIADTDRVVELEVDDAEAFERSVEEAHAGSTSLLWFDDSRRRRVGVPRERLAYIEIETETERHTVGFGG